MIDNQSAEMNINGEVTSSRSKHIDIKTKHVIDLREQGLIETRYVVSELQIADLLTKPLAKNVIKRLGDLMQLKDNKDEDTTSST
ncbi:MAG: Ty1/Copia family ribonuclease HI [Herbaspirillum sp.]|nr:Ty1/Copia family ribonuclease HI [Herbaspirillum sp.]